MRTAVKAGTSIDELLSESAKWANFAGVHGGLGLDSDTGKEKIRKKSTLFFFEDGKRISIPQQAYRTMACEMALSDDADRAVLLAGVLAAHYNSHSHTRGARQLDKVRRMFKLCFSSLNFGSSCRFRREF